MKKFIFIIIGLTLFAADAHALDAPGNPDVISNYVQSIIDEAETRLNYADDGNSAGDCDPSESEYYAAQVFRSMFFDIDASATQPQRDVARSMCYMQDIRALEKYITDLINMSLNSARDCNINAEGEYYEVAKFVWSKLWNIRRYGLRPDVQTPVTGTGSSSVPSDAVFPDDDALCAYNSQYADMSLLGVGCQDEEMVIEDVLDNLMDYEVEIPRYSQALIGIIEEANRFVDGISIVRKPRPRIALNPVFRVRTIDNAGESGCKGWPSDVGGVVTGENIPLMNYSPVVLTNELSDTIAYIQERSSSDYFEYEKALEEQTEEEGGGTLGQSFILPDLSAINRDHLDRETLSILSIRDPQVHMENIANSLHMQTRKFASQTLATDAPMRDFIRRYSEFLARMCVNRGCGKNLLRVIELSLRDECFSAFTKDRFFRSGQSSSTLSACRAIYVGP